MAGFEKMVPMACFEKVVPTARFEKTIPRSQKYSSTYSVRDKFTAVDIYVLSTRESQVRDSTSSSKSNHLKWHMKKWNNVLLLLLLHMISNPLYCVYTHLYPDTIIV